MFVGVVKAVTPIRIYICAYSTVCTSARTMSLALTNTRLLRYPRLLLQQGWPCLCSARKPSRNVWTNALCKACVSSNNINCVCDNKTFCVLFLELALFTSSLSYGAQYTEVRTHVYACMYVCSLHASTPLCFLHTSTHTRARTRTHTHTHTLCCHMYI